MPRKNDAYYAAQYEVTRKNKARRAARREVLAAQSIARQNAKNSK